MEKSTVLDRCVIAHPPEPWKFWKKKTNKLSECKNPVMRMNRKPVLRTNDHGNERYIRDVFVASFDMLWSPPKSKHADQTTIERITKYGKAPHSWLRTLFAMLWLKCKLRPDIIVRDHEYTLQMLDNPGFEALIEYK
ncbi:hypothetical protein BGX34_008224, partial [Mortierella sp. NVP85]